MAPQKPVEAANVLEAGMLGLYEAGVKVTAGLPFDVPGRAAKVLSQLAVTEAPLFNTTTRRQ